MYIARATFGEGFGEVLARLPLEELYMGFSSKFELPRGPPTFPPHAYLPSLNYLGVVLCENFPIVHCSLQHPTTTQTSIMWEHEVGRPLFEEEAGVTLLRLFPPILS